MSSSSTRNVIYQTSNFLRSVLNCDKLCETLHLLAPGSFQRTSALAQLVPAPQSTVSGVLS